MKNLKFTVGILLLFFACKKNIPKDSVSQKTLTSIETKLTNPKGKTIENRFLTPEGFQRIKAENHSFQKYLRELPLKPYGSAVLIFDGRIKQNHNIYDAVVDLKIGKRNLHQCADAVMRLKAEHLWKEKKYDEIHFNFTNGFRVDYSEWSKGKRIIVEGNKTYWKQKATASNTYKNFWEYMEIIFSYAGTLSLSKELKPISIKEMEIGDIFIQGGFPGHAIIVVDIAENKQTKEKIFLLAQSYMPAQELQILKNPQSKNLSAWYSLDFGTLLKTPEWTFNASDLKRFEE